MSKVLSFRVPDDVAEWVDGYAAERGVSRQDLLAGAISNFQEDAKAGVPEIRELVRKQRREAKPGDCVCPVFEDGVRGFRQSCPVHGFGDAPVEERRAHFNQVTAARTELFAQLNAPASTRRWGKNP